MEYVEFEYQIGGAPYRSYNPLMTYTRFFVLLYLVEQASHTMSIEPC